MGLFSREKDSYTIENGVCTVKFEKKGVLDKYRVSAILHNNKVRLCKTINVVIGEDVTAISESAFCEHTSLTSIVILKGVTSIGERAFYDCKSLTSIVIPEGVTSIGYDAFYGCSSLASIVIPEGVTSIGDEAFYYCDSLTSIVIPEGVTSISDSAFYGCSSLTSIEIPEGVTSIGNQAFYYCDSLTSIVIPKGVTFIGYGAFYGCSSLTSIVIPEGVTSIGDEAFWDCDSLTSVKLPKSVTSIGESAFSGCRNLTIYCEAKAEPSGFGKGWKGNYAPVVWNCKNNDIADDGNVYTVYDGIRYSIKEEKASAIALIIKQTNVKVPSKIPFKEKEYPVTNVDAFEYCTSLTSVELPDGLISIYGCAFKGCSSLTSIVIPSSVTTIGDHAFEGCCELEKIVIPESVEIMGGFVFDDCSSLKIYCQAPSKPSGWSSSWNSAGRPVVWGYEDTERKKSINDDVANEWIDVEGDDCTVNFAVGVVTRQRAKALLADERVKSVNRVTVNLCDGVEAVEELAFYNFDCIAAVNIAKSVEKMGKAVFYGCGSVDVFCRFEAEKSGWDECWASRDCHVEFDK